MQRSMLSLRRSAALARRLCSSLQRPRVPIRAPDADADAEPPLLALPPQYALRRNEAHCLVGVNGSGKSRLLRRLRDAAAAAGSSRARAVRVGALSLDAHRALLAEHGDRVVAELLGGVGSPAARDVIVRLGLFPVWESRVRVLSTGEMRKLLLALALLERPRRADVLLLDQPFDGLDASARKQLEWLLGQLTRGFTRLLVDTGGRNDAFAFRTPVVMVANRLDHVLPEVATHVVLVPKRDDGEIQVRSLAEDPGAVKLELEAFLAAHSGGDARADGDATVDALVRRLYEATSAPVDMGADTVAIEMHGMSVAYDRRMLLQDVRFSRRRGEHWALLGPNGSGKSSLLRVLMQTEGHGQVGGRLRLRGDRIAVVSTDQHVDMLDSVEVATQTAMQLIQAAADDDGGGGGASLAETALQLVRVARETASRPFGELSQGEQKLVQIAIALAQRPAFLLLDEITHGLDAWNRARVLRVIDAVGRVASDRTHMVLITHHEDEIPPSFQSIVEIRDQRLVCRPRAPRERGLQ
ncbi:hypothetical protein P43SY_009882 [Pythium insidiosum]|uniref:ABC transporter domain-containing protein n=1 Tax=Pythium insidiosum TaxID=114742 RepID=A0AAD5Q4Y4_PYTIN|nr:hypothetical protein P43SY_009882 [Pythium insidiosum]